LFSNFSILLSINLTTSFLLLGFLTFVSFSSFLLSEVEPSSVVSFSSLFSAASISSLNLF